MKKSIKIWMVLAAALSLAACDKNKNEAEEVKKPGVTLNVDVVLPESIRSQWQNTIDWALFNIARAQQLQEQEVVLNLRYHDEDTEDLDKLGYQLTHPEEGEEPCDAIIGPYHSSNATDLLKYAKSKRLPVLMPTCTSAELQRTNARNTYSWFFTESDITQCEIMLAVCRAMKYNDVALIYSDDTYGQSFNDWFGYFTTELEMHIAGQGPIAYSEDMDVEGYLQQATEDMTGAKLMVLVALSNAEDFEKVCSRCSAYAKKVCVNEEDSPLQSIYTLCSDTALDATLLLSGKNLSMKYGVCPYASMNYGFPQSYETRFGRQAMTGEAQIYDALTLLALGAARRLVSPDKCLIRGEQVTYSEKPYEAGLTDYMRSVVSSSEGEASHWNDIGLAVAFREVYAGRDINMNGATGALNFDSETYTNILNTTYVVWGLEQDTDNDGSLVNNFQPLVFLSTAGSNSEASSVSMWELAKTWEQVFNDEGENEDLNLPTLEDHWAVVFSPSTSWSNYRHQADAFAIYQGLKEFGYDDDHIILIVEDNLAFDEHNIFPGQIFVERSSEETDDPLVNKDVREGAVVDYHFSDLTQDDLIAIMTGQSSDRLPHVIHSNEHSNVFFFWSGHGGQRQGPLWGNEDAREYFGTDRIRDLIGIMNENDLYRRMFLAIETCYSGKWGEAITGFPNVLMLTAASPYESSKADVHDKDLGIYLSNAFTRTFRRQISNNPGIIIYDLYKELARTTVGSHVSIYNNNNYGSIYTEDLAEYFVQE